MRLSKNCPEHLRQLLKETARIWSPGLGQNDYIEFIERQLNHRFARNGLEFLTVCPGSEAEPSAEPTIDQPENGAGCLGGLKYYRLSFRARSKSEPLKLAGLGAVFTIAEKRGTGIGKTMIELAIRRALEENLDGLLLYSDIDNSYYHRLGFRDLPSRQFFLRPGNLDAAQIEPLIEESESIPIKSIPITCQPLSLASLDCLSSYYKRFQARLELSQNRSDDYWHFMFDKESFIERKRNGDWPSIELLSSTTESTADNKNWGYALIRVTGSKLRVLEMTGSEITRTFFWARILRTAIERSASSIVGWESLFFDSLPSGLSKQFGIALQIERRSHGKGMILALSKKVANWNQISPCPLLEFDHF
ncbi:MAG: GNAT family N-acetyltransferase [Candidatus Obscuribacterales bacterium]|nr:GNAT family N-acetyltransferase [Candidatus Obscuribacterales bacterium]